MFFSSKLPKKRGPMLSRVRHLSRRADAAAKRQGHSWPGRICIGISVGVGSYLGARYGEKHGEKVTKAFIDRSLAFVPLPMKGSISSVLAKRFGPQVGVHCGMLLGAAVGGAVAKQSLTWGEKLLRKKRQASEVEAKKIQLQGVRLREVGVTKARDLVSRTERRLSELRSSTRALSLPPLRKSFALRLPTRVSFRPLKLVQE